MRVCFLDRPMSCRLATSSGLKKVVAKWQPSLDKDVYAVGYFRSHTRDGFALNDRTLSCSAIFPDPLDVALLVKPFATRPATAGFFLKEKGVLVTASTPMEFNSKLRRHLRWGRVIDTAPEIAPPKREPTAAPPLVGLLSQFRARKPLRRSHTESCPRLMRRPRPPARRNLLWAAFCVALLAFGGAVGYEYAGRALLGRKTRALRVAPWTSERGPLLDSTADSEGREQRHGQVGPRTLLRSRQPSTVSLPSRKGRTART